MNKEMFISSSPHETKVAVCEDGQLVEVYFERDTDVGLVGGIYKGRVNRVLPGMQSAFVDIGLDRDAFLYVSDFSLQDQDEFEGVLNESQTRGATIEIEPRSSSAETETATGAGQRVAAAPHGAEADESAAPEGPAPTVHEPSASESSGMRLPGPAAGASDEEKGSHHRSHRGRRRSRHGRGGGFGDRRPGRRPEPQTAPAPATTPKPEPVDTSQSFEVLPGESLAKHRHPAPENSTPSQAASRTPGEDSAPEPITTPAVIPATSEHQVEPFRDLRSEGTRSEVRSKSYSEGGDEPSRSDAQPFVVPASRPFSRARKAWEGASTEAPEPAAGVTPETEKASEIPAASGPEAEEEAKQAGESLAADSGVEAQPEAPSASGGPSGTEEGSEGDQQVSGTSEGAKEPSGRSYTLREPQGRPHFAPRRGRRGRRRTSKNPRRSDGSESTRAGSPQSQGQGQGLQISELLKEGQEIIVQIAKEPLGTKGARITSHVALPGRYVVYMPTITHIGVSRKISSEQERLRLRNIVLEHRGPLTGGFIVRTAGEGRTDDEIKADLQFLTALWNEIRNRAEQTKAPAILYRDLDLAQRLMRDLVTPDFKSIWLDNEADYERVVEFVNRLQPSLVGIAKLHTRQASLFEEHGVQEEIEKALRPKVWLKSGGYIVINQTEALVAIDVNTGKYVGKTNRLEDTIVKTNIDAVNEIVRQIRLRDLGGIIVIDFIDMDERRNRNKVVQALEEAMRFDRAPTKVLSFNDFGLVAVTRKRVKQSLERTLCDPCTYCNGSGWVKSVSTVCYEILAEARKMAGEIEGKSITLRVNPEVAQALKSKDGTLVTEIEALTHKNLVIKSDPNIHQERFEIF